MPPICLHLAIAEEAASELHHPALHQGTGNYLLGSTAPDIRIFIGASREATHFVSLRSKGRTSGLKAMFQRYPDLADKETLNEETMWFVAGYLSHLVTDEAWIHEIYRPFFGNDSPAGGDARANLLDRALQFELERREHADTGLMKKVKDELVGSAYGVNIGFINPFSLGWWRDFVISAVTDGHARAGLRAFMDEYMIVRQSSGHVCDEPPASVLEKSIDRALEIVGEEPLRLFCEHAVEGSVAAAREYLG